MKLEKLLELGRLASLGFDDAEKKEIEWEGHKFFVFVKKEQSVADLEYIYAPKTEEDSYGARRVSRFIRLDGGEKIPYDIAKSLKPELLTLLSGAVNEVHKGPEDLFNGDEADEQKKD